MRREYHVVARHRQTKEKRFLRCWGTNKNDAIDHARHALGLVIPNWTFTATRTGNEAATES